MTVTVVEQLEAQAAELAQCQTELGEALGAVKAANDSATDKLTEKDVEIATLTESLSTAQADNETAQAIIADLAANVESVTASHTKLTEDYAIARRALGNPAFASAARATLKTGTQDGGAAADGQDGDPDTKEEAIAQYNKIPSSDGRTRADYRKTHKELLGL